MINGISSQNIDISQLQQKMGPRKSPEEMFSEMSKAAGGDGKTVTKEQLQNYLQKLQSEGKGDSKEAGMIGDLVNNFDKISNGSDSISADSIKTAMDNGILKPKGGPKPPGGGDLFKDLSSAVGGDGKSISKDELQSYLQKLTAQGQSDSPEAQMIEDLLNNFDKIAGESDTITSDNLKAAFEDGTIGKKQDSGKMTKRQLQPPIDFKV